MSEVMKSETKPDNSNENLINGVNLDTLMGTVTAMQADPELGKCRFRATNKWLDGNRNQSTVHGFYGAKQEMVHKQVFTMDADEPDILAGNDQGANPVEHLLHALASCLTTSIVAHAAVLGIKIEELEAELEGDIDLNGFLGLDENVAKGYTEIRVRYQVKTDPKHLERIRRLINFSPVYQTISNGTTVDVQIQLK
jgi:uncharacterized OsmC-like protein